MATMSSTAFPSVAFSTVSAGERVSNGAQVGGQSGTLTAAKSLTDTESELFCSETKEFGERDNGEEGEYEDNRVVYVDEV